MDTTVGISYPRYSKILEPRRPQKMASPRRLTGDHDYRCAALASQCRLQQGIKDVASSACFCTMETGV